MNSSNEPFTWAVRALAQPAKIQIRLFPEFVSVTFELITEFEETFHAEAVADGVHRWTGEQLLSLRALDAQLKLMSDASKEEVWDDDDALAHPDWEQVRKLAQAVIAAFGWPAAQLQTHNF